VRREAQLRHAQPGLQIVPLRGNVDTRLRKLRDEDLDGILLAYAGLKRLGLASEATDVLSAEVLLPAVGQGCLALECRDNDAETGEIIARLDHLPTRQAVTAERAFLRALGGSCQTPIAGAASIQDGALTLAGLVAAPDGTILIRDQARGLPSDAERLGTQLAQRLLSKGADRLLGIA
jgi:hydroxymethylbilane synthase